MSGNEIIIVITDRCKKLILAILSLKSTALDVVYIILDHWIAPYGIFAFLLMENGRQFVRKLFETLCMLLPVELLTTMTFYPQTSVQGECY